MLFHNTLTRWHAISAIKASTVQTSKRLRPLSKSQEYQRINVERFVQRTMGAFYLKLADPEKFGTDGSDSTYMEYMSVRLAHADDLWQESTG